MTVRWLLVSTMQGLRETILPCVAHHLNRDAERNHEALIATAYGSGAPYPHRGMAAHLPRQGRVSTVHETAGPRP